MMECRYDEPRAQGYIQQTLKGILPPLKTDVVFLCIGSDRHILDCLGPLTGSLLQDKDLDLNVYGTLEMPLHARNLMARLEPILVKHPGALHMAIDASAGGADELGLLRLRDEPLVPGKALLKSLPPLGHYSLTGVLSLRGQGRFKSPPASSLNPVYQMARLISQAVEACYNEASDPV